MAPPRCRGTTVQYPSGWRRESMTSLGGDDLKAEFPEGLDEFRNRPRCARAFVPDLLVHVIITLHGE